MITRGFRRRVLWLVSGRLGSCLLAAALLTSGSETVRAQVQAPSLVTCGDGALPAQPSTSAVPDLKVTGTCTVGLGTTYYYGAISIVRGGTLLFRESTYRGPDGGPQDSKTHLWASSIIIENEGAMVADGGPYMQGMTAFGYYGGTLTIHLYGSNEAIWDRNAHKFTQENAGVGCMTDQSSAVGPCGIPVLAADGVTKFWENNGKDILPLPGEDKDRNPVRDYFYQYGPLYGDGRCLVSGKEDKTVNFSNGLCRNSAGTPVDNAKPAGFFGTKVLAVSFGGTLDLAGWKGATYDGYWDNVPDHSGTSWMRLADGQSLEVGDQSLTLERYAGWHADDEIVVTTTDYLPSHSEKLQINADYKFGPTIPFRAVESGDGKIRWRHNGTRYGGPNDGTGPTNDPTKNQWTRRLEERIRTTMDPELVKNGAETRAAVALLTRSIRIVSGGDVAGAEFGHRQSDNKDVPIATYSYGGHMVVRQGFKKVQIKGVEFAQMGQGGRLGHYPVHFHMTRKTPDRTYVKDSSINESMTRWIVIHSTQGVTVARNVGYKSIGHGFYLESGTETDNKFHSNIGIFARAAVADVDPQDKTKLLPNAQNPRMIPGILADNTDPLSYKSPNVAGKAFIYRSDVENPTVFWFTNGWNDFIGNMAAGAGTCGAAYWFVPAANSDMVEMSTSHEHMKWLSGYAGLQKTGKDADGFDTPGLAGATPLKSFYKNYATSTMHSFQTTPDAPLCGGVIAANAVPGNFPVLRAVPSDAPTQARHMVPAKDPKHEEPDTLNDHYYPHIAGARLPVRCTPKGDDYDCSNVTTVCAHPPADNCAATVIDHYTSSFHWAHGTVSAIWLRPQWYLLTNSVLSDVQNGGITFITGGDYTHSSVIDGYWGLAKSSVFIGNTQDNVKSPWASNIGPFNLLTKLTCDTAADEDNYCLNAKESISMPTDGFFTNQRLANVYDGPSYQDSNAYLDIKTAECPEGAINSGCMYGTKKSVLRLKTQKPDPKDSRKTVTSCYLPNAAIGWKQPNGFFYPPAFHTRNLQFDNVDLRHYVINPLFKAPDLATNFGQGGTYLTDPDAVKEQYCVEEAKYANLFNSFTSIDRQTVLNDTDGTLTGLSNSLADSKDPLMQRLKQTISINEDPFFSAPREAAECGSAVGGNADAKNACNPPDKSKPPVTARTSPYDYVATMLYHRQSIDDVWDIGCTNPGCYGVPLYRQYLTKDELKRWTDSKCSDQAKTLKQDPQCRWPFIRMAGEALAQRETLTINNGTYYVDTTVSKDRQEKENYTTTVLGALRSRNVFKAGETYYMFFAYAKTSTVQTYKIYVGKDFKPATHFKPGRISVDGFEWLDKGPSEPWATPSPAIGADGILTVNIDFSGTKVDPSTEPAGGLCQPRTFCTSGIDPDTKQKACVSAVQPNDPLMLANTNFAEQNAKVCQLWAAKDLDCPPIERNSEGRWTDGGCYAFAFTMPTTGFAADDLYRRPEPEPFPATVDARKKQGLPDWTTKFTQGVKNQNDTCFYPKVPGTDCKLP
jgi:hypothetical protein